MSELSLLIVEDEKNLGETLQEFLQSKGIKAFLAATIANAKQLFQEHNPSIVLMDIGLPDGSGLELAKQLRGLRKDFVLLFLSALNDPETRVEGLEIGADDYIIKPFQLRELYLRLERILRSQESLGKGPETIEHGQLKIWFKRFELQDAEGQIIPLNQKECAILEMLYRKSPEVVTRDEMIEKIWGEESFPSNRTVDNYIVKLRKWCESDSSQALQIINVRGVGYKLEIKNKG